MLVLKNSNNNCWKKGDKILTKEIISVDTGGSFQLPDGDVLVIERQWAETNYDEGRGIVFYLESGENCSCYLYNPNNEMIYQSCSFIDFNDQAIYDEGNILRFYKGETYNGDQGSGESWIRQNGVEAIITLTIRNGWWERISEPYHANIELGDDTLDIYWNAAAHRYEVGVYFTLASGRPTVGLYEDQGGMIESGYGWFGEAYPYDQAKLTIYFVDWYDIQDQISYPLNSQDIFEVMRDLGVRRLVLYFNGETWYLGNS